MGTEIIKTREGTIVESVSETESIARSIVPYNRDDNRSRYLGFRCCGFTSREAIKLAGCAPSTLSLWRKDQTFLDLENRIPEFREELSLEYANIEFIRNYRLVMEKDHRVLKKSLSDKKEDVLSDNEQAYLLKLRTQYTPQQLSLLEALIKAEKSVEGFNFTDFVITASKETRELKFEKK